MATGVPVLLNTQSLFGTGYLVRVLQGDAAGIAFAGDSSASDQLGGRGVGELHRELQGCEFIVERLQLVVTAQKLYALHFGSRCEDEGEIGGAVELVRPEIEFWI